MSCELTALENETLQFTPLFRSKPIHVGDAFLLERRRPAIRPHVLDLLDVVVPAGCGSRAIAQRP